MSGKGSGARDPARRKCTDAEYGDRFEATFGKERWDLSEWTVCDPAIMDQMLADRNARESIAIREGITLEELSRRSIERRLRRGSDD